MCGVTVVTFSVLCLFFLFMEDDIFKRKKEKKSSIETASEMTETSATSLTHYTAVRSGKENCLLNPDSHVCSRKKRLSSLGEVAATSNYSVQTFKTDRRRRQKCPSVVFF